MSSFQPTLRLATRVKEYFKKIHYSEDSEKKSNSIPNGCVRGVRSKEHTIYSTNTHYPYNQHYYLS